MRIYVFCVTYCYFGVNKILEFDVEARNLVSAWRKIVLAVPLSSSVIDIRFKMSIEK